MKILLIVLGLSVLTSIPSPILQTKRPAQAPRPEVLTGTIGIDERYFIDENDLKVRSVANRNILKGRGGHRVRVRVTSAQMTY